MLKSQFLNRLFGFVAATFMLLAASSVRAEQFSCEDGTNFEGVFTPDYSQVMIKLRGARIILRPARSASGTRYVAAGYELWGKGRNYLYRRPGHKQTKCTARPSRIWHTQLSNGRVVTADCKDDCEEDIGILLECKGAHELVDISVPWAATEKGRDKAPINVQFVIDGQVLNYQAITQHWGMIGYLPSLKLSRFDPLFGRLAIGQKLTVKFAGTATKISLRGAGAAMAQFSAFCAAMPQVGLANQSPVPKPILPPAKPGDVSPPAHPSTNKLKWQYYGDARRGQASLTYGIPETDAIVVNMECRKTHPGALQMLFFAAPDGLVPGTPAQVTLRLPDWSYLSYRGVVDGRGMVVVRGGLDARGLFAQMAGVVQAKGDIFVLINGQPAGTIKGHAGTPQARKFKAFCAG